MKNEKSVGAKAIKKGYCDPKCKRILRSKIRAAQLSDEQGRLDGLREVQNLAIQYTQRGLLSAEKCSMLLMEIGFMR